jgi:D-inositol-3-phosphate glycosyltransferase
MKVAVISYHTCPYERFGRGYSGGMNVFLRETLERLSKKGVCVQIFTRSEGDDFISSKNENLTVHHISCGLPENPLLRDFLEGEEKYFRRLSRIIQPETDLVFSNYWLSSPASIRLKILGGYPMVHMHHTLEKVKESHSGYRYRSARIRSARLFFEFYVQKWADSILFPSWKDREVAARYYPDAHVKGEVVNPGISSDFLTLPSMGREARSLVGVPPGGTLFLFAGRDERTKNLEGLICAFEELGLEDTYLLLSGEHGDVSGNRVISLPVSPREKLVSHVDGADCVVIPSFYESFGIFGMEALARGTPLIAPRETFLGEYLKEHEGGELFDPMQEGSLTRAMRNFIGKRGEYRKRAEEISRSASSFTWERTCSQLLRVFGRASEGGPPCQ